MSGTRDGVTVRRAVDVAGPEPFRLLETMRLEDGTIARLERHLLRMRRSAGHFGYACDEARLRSELAHTASTRAHGVWRVRLLAGPDGSSSITCTPHVDETGGPRRVAFAAAAIDAHSPFVRNKTTRRHAYDAARQFRPGVDDVLLWNDCGEITESTVANLVIELDGVRVTPPERCGLLPGVLRAELIQRGELIEQVITKDDVTRAPRMWLLNSLRGWVAAELSRRDTPQRPVP